MSRYVTFLVFLILFSSFAFAVDIGYGKGDAVYIGGNEIYGLLRGDNIWTGQNFFNNYTVINYETFNVTGNTTATNFCYQNGTCVSDQVTNIYSTISELNDSVQFYSNEVCPNDYYAYSRLQNGTWLCRPDEDTDNQNLQSVTNYGATTTNKIIINTDDTAFLTPSIFVKNNNTYGSAYTRYENDNGSQIDIGAYGLGISQSAFPKQLKDNESAIGISSRNADIWIVTRDNDSILFGGTPDDNLSNANFSVAIRPDLQAIQVQGNKFIIPKKSDGGHTLWEYSEDQQIAGGVPFCKASIDGTGDLAILDCVQVGRNNSGSIRMNSQFAVPKDYIQYVVNATGYELNQSLLDINMTEFVFNLTDYVQYCDYRENVIGDLPEGCKFYADTSGQGLVTSTDNLEAMGKTVLHDGTVMYNSMDFIGRYGNDYNLLFNGYNGGKLHIRETALVEGNFSIFMLTIADFDDDTLGFFKEVSPPASNPNRIWQSVDDIKCWNDRCGRARGGELKTMEFSESTTFVGGTINVTEINMSFYLTTTGLDGGESFYVELDDNQGNTSTIYTQSSNQNDVFVELTFPDLYENKANVTTRFIHDANVYNERSWVDEVNIVVTPIEPVITNESYYAGQITLGQDTNPLTECYIRKDKQYNETTNEVSDVMVLKCPNIDIQGNLTETSITVISQNVTGDVEALSFTLNETTITDWSQAGNNTYLTLSGNNANDNIDVDIYNISANAFKGQLNTTDGYGNYIYTDFIEWGQSNYTFPVLKGSAVNGTNNVFFVDRGFFLRDVGQGTQFYMTSNDSLKNVQMYYNPTSDSFSLTAGQDAAGVTDFEINMPLVSDKHALFKDSGTFLDTTINDGGNRFKIGYDLSPAPIGADLFRIYHGGIGYTEARIETLPDTSFVLGTPDLVLASATGDIILEDNTTIEGNTAIEGTLDINVADSVFPLHTNSEYWSDYGLSLGGFTVENQNGVRQPALYFSGDASNGNLFYWGGGYVSMPSAQQQLFYVTENQTDVNGGYASLNMEYGKTEFNKNPYIANHAPNDVIMYSNSGDWAFYMDESQNKVLLKDTEVQGTLNVTETIIANAFNGELNTSSNDVGWITSKEVHGTREFPVLTGYANGTGGELGLVKTGLYLMKDASRSDVALYLTNDDFAKSVSLSFDPTANTSTLSSLGTIVPIETNLLWDFSRFINIDGTSDSKFATLDVGTTAVGELGFNTRVDFPITYKDFKIKSMTDNLILESTGGLIQLINNTEIEGNLNVTESVTANKLKVNNNNYFTVDGTDAVKMVLGGSSGEYFTVDALNGLDFYDGGGSMKLVPMGSSGGMEISTEIGKITFLTSDIYSTANVHFTGTGTNTIGETGSTNYFGASGSTYNYFGASGSNEYGNGAVHNNFGEYSALNHIGENAELNTFGDDADENRFGSTSGVNKWYGNLNMQSYDLNTTGTIKAGEFESSDGSTGITNTTGYWLCNSSDCSTTCQAQIKDGLITGCT